MNGSWHIYPAGARWQPPGPRHAGARLHRQAACARRLQRSGRRTADRRAISSATRSCGRSDRICSGDAVRSRRGGAPHAGPRRPIRSPTSSSTSASIAGIGNVFKSEILFLAGLHPVHAGYRPDRRRSRRIVGHFARTAGRERHGPIADAEPATGRRTTRSLNPNENLWVYSRGGRPCRRCGTAIQSRKTGPDARVTYWCPSCQAGPRNS